jgi:hypothetical protein
MAEPRKKPTAPRKRAATKPAARRATATKAPSKARTASKAGTAKKPATKARPKAAVPGRRPTARPRVDPKPAQRRSKRTSAARTSDEAARDVALFDNLNALKDALAEHVVLSAERLQEAMDDAVRRGRMLPTDAHDLAERLRLTGRRQLEELISDLDRRLGGGR